MSAPSAPEQDSGGFRVPPPPKTIGPARWLARGETISIGGLRIDGGLFHVGQPHPGPLGRLSGSIVDPRLLLAEPGSELDHEDDFIFDYRSMSPSQRRGYLEWLAGKRIGGDALTAYPLLFLCGIERRFIVDLDGDAEHAEAIDIVNLLRWLIEVHPNYPEVLLRGRELFGMVAALRRKPTLNQIEEEELFFPKEIRIGKALYASGLDLRISLALRFALSHAAKSQVRITAAQALIVVRMNTFIRPTWAFEYFAEFTILFLARFDTHFDTGLIFLV